MSHLRLFAKYWLPVVLFMALIFSASGDAGSAERSSRYLEPVLRWLFPFFTDAGIGRSMFAVRKLAHFTEYAVLVTLLWRALRHSSSDLAAGWSWPQALTALLLVSLYAASDEMHQAFVPNRQASMVDVAIDISGAVTALFLLWVWSRRRRPRACPV